MPLSASKWESYNAQSSALRLIFQFILQSLPELLLWSERQIVKPMIASSRKCWRGYLPLHPRQDDTLDEARGSRQGIRDSDASRLQAIFTLQSLAQQFFSGWWSALIRPELGRLSWLERQGNARNDSLKSKKLLCRLVLESLLSKWTSSYNLELGDQFRALWNKLGSSLILPTWWSMPFLRAFSFIF